MIHVDGEKTMFVISPTFGRHFLLSGLAQVIVDSMHLRIVGFPQSGIENSFKWIQLSPFVELQVPPVCWQLQVNSMVDMVNSEDANHHHPFRFECTTTRTGVGLEWTLIYHNLSEIRILFHWSEVFGPISSRLHVFWSQPCSATNQIRIFLIFDLDLQHIRHGLGSFINTAL